MDQFIKMSEIVVSRNGDSYRTIVGSCIALCLWDKKKQLGGMAHIMLPRRNGDKKAGPGKYADTAVQALLNKMIHRGCKPANLTASVFGGASLFKHVEPGSYHPIGRLNYQVIREQLDHFGIQISKEEIGGSRGKRIVFDCASGNVDSFELGTQNGTD